MTSDALQDAYAPNGTCFGCGPKNDKGLRIKSRVNGDEVAATWRAEKHHEAFEGALSGDRGDPARLPLQLTAAYHLMRRASLPTPPCTVTAEYSVKLLRPTPTDGPIELVARPVEIADDRAVVEAELRAGGKVCATARGTFVAVKPGHPAYHRW